MRASKFFPQSNIATTTLNEGRNLEPDESIANKF
jgi:hypothetical protein